MFIIFHWLLSFLLILFYVHSGSVVSLFIRKDSFTLPVCVLWFVTSHLHEGISMDSLCLLEDDDS
jgi:hypothetical protein